MQPSPDPSPAWGPEPPLESDSVRRLNTRPTQAAASGAQRLAFWSPKAGAGTTTVATSVAALLAHEDGARAQGSRHRVVLIEVGGSDADLHLCTNPPVQRLQELLTARDRLDHALLDSLVPPVRTGLQVLSLPAIQTPPGAPVDPVMVELINRIGHLCDHLVLDLGCTPHPGSVWSTFSPDHSCLVCSPDLPSLRRLHQSMPGWMEVLSTGIFSGRIHVLAQPVREGQQTLELEEFQRLMQPMKSMPGVRLAPMKVLPSIPQAAQAALLQGVTLQEHQARQSWSREFMEAIGPMLIQGSPAPMEATASARGLFQNWKDRLWTRWQTA